MRQDMGDWGTSYNPVTRLTSLTYVSPKGKLFFTGTQQECQAQLEKWQEEYEPDMFLAKVGAPTTSSGDKPMSMSNKDFIEFAEAELKSVLEIVKAKNADYTTGAGAFANFEVTEKLGLSGREMGLLIRMVDKIQRLKSFLAKGKLEVKGEGAQDAARDILGYSLVLLGMLKEREGEPAKPEAPAEPKKLQLKLGKRYKRGDGRATGYLVANEAAPKTKVIYPFRDPKLDVSYTDRGHWLSSIPHPQMDLVEELDD